MDQESYEHYWEMKIGDRFFCRRNLICQEGCSKCEVYGECFMCTSFGFPDRCQLCTRSEEVSEIEGKSPAAGDRACE